MVHHLICRVAVKWKTELAHNDMNQNQDILTFSGSFFLSIRMIPYILGEIGYKTHFTSARMPADEQHTFES